MSKLSNGIKITNIALGLLLSVAWNSNSMAEHGASAGEHEESTEEHANPSSEVHADKEGSVVNAAAIEALEKEAFIGIAKKVSEDRMSFQAAVLLFPILKSEPGLIQDPKAQEHVGNAIRALKGPSDKEKYSKEERAEIIDRIIKKKTKDGKLQSISAVDMSKMIEEEGKILKAEKAKREEKAKHDAEAEEKAHTDEARKKVGSARALSPLEIELLGKLHIPYDPAQDKKALVDSIKAKGEEYKRELQLKVDELKKEQKHKEEVQKANDQRELDGASQGLKDAERILANLSDLVKELEK